MHFTLNSLCVRNFVPRGLEETELVWTYLGYADDSEEMTAMRVLQANLTGAAGLVSLEDGCINEFVQRGTRGSERCRGRAGDGRAWARVQRILARDGSLDPGLLERLSRPDGLRMIDCGDAPADRGFPCSTAPGP